MTAVQHTIAEGEHPHHVIVMQQPETAKNIHVYLNGDKFYPGRKFVLNRRHIADFDGFLNQVTMGIKAPFGAVRNIYTPQSGHRVQDLNQLQTGMQVVAGGVERFRKMDYREIGSKRKPKPRRNYLDIKLNPNRMLVSARWRKYVKDPVQIFVYGNGDVMAPAMRLLLIPRCMKSWDLVLSEITEKICIRTGQAVRKLYDLNFRLLNDPSELENGHYYVAVGTEKLKRYPYGDVHNATPSPRKITHQPLPPIKRHHKPRPPRDEEETTYTKMYAQKKQQKVHIEETTVMGASAATGYRPLRTKKFKPQKPSAASETSPDEGAVFPPKPVKVKRLSGISNAAHDPHPPSEDGDGVFKTETKVIIAETVAEDANTKTELPIDQVKAVEVEEENIEEVTSARSDDVIAHDQDAILLERKADDINSTEEVHLGDSPRSETPKVHDEEEDIKPSEEIDDISFKEEAIIAVETAAIVLAESPEPLAETPKQEELAEMEEEFPDHKEVAADDETADQDHQDMSDVNPDAVESEVKSEAAEDVPASVEPEESVPTPDAIVVEEKSVEDASKVDSPVNEAPVEDEMTYEAPEEVAAPIEDKPVESTEDDEPEEKVETPDAGNIENDVAEASVEAMEEPEKKEEEEEEHATNDEEPVSDTRSLTPSSPKPREDENTETIEGVVAGEEDNTASEEVAGATEEKTEEEKSKPEDDTAASVKDDEDAAPLNENASGKAESVHEDERAESEVKEDKDQKVDDDKEDSVANPEDSRDNHGEGEGAMARFVTTRPASEALTADDDKTDPGTPSTKRSLANGDIGGIPAEVQP